MVRERNIFEILSVLDRANKPLTSVEIMAELDGLGISLTDRMIRNYLQEFDKQGFTAAVGKGGRKITVEGRDELVRLQAFGQFDYVDQIVRLITESGFDLNKQKGKVIASLSFIDEGLEEEVKAVLVEVCGSGFFPSFIKLARAGETLCHKVVPEGMFGLATLSSINVDAALMKNGIYVLPDWPLGLLAVKDSKPVRFSSVIGNKGTSVDPALLFFNKRMTSVCEAASEGKGELLADYRIVPYTARTKTLRLLKKTAELFGGTIFVGGSGEKMLGVSTNAGNTGSLAVSGESLPAALEEKGIKTNTETVAGAINFNELESIAPVQGEVILL